jgi:predicted DNA-binding protein
MATYCDNTLIISGNKTALIKFIIDHNIDEIDEDNNDYSFVEEFENIETYNPLYLQKEERLNILYPGKNYTLHYEDASADESIPDFSVLEPTPNEKNDYYWRVDRWGTEANSSDFEIELEENQMTIEFKTLWTPPKEWVVTASEYYSELTFDLSFFSDILPENGPRVWGSIKCKNGEIIEEDDYQHNHLITCPSLSPTLEKIKNLPSKNDYPISDYITLFEQIDYDDNESIDMEDIADNLEDDINENQKNIMEQIVDIWDEMIDKLDSSYSDLQRMFPRYVKEILEHYKKD